MGEGTDSGADLYTYADDDPIGMIDPTGLFLSPGQQPVTITGGTPNQRAAVRNSVNCIFSTPRGRDLLNEIIGSPYWPGSPKTIVINNLGLNGALPYGSTIDLDPDALIGRLIDTTQGLQPLDLTREVGHEMGHAADGRTDPYNIDFNENPIMRQLGQKYDRIGHKIH